MTKNIKVQPPVVDTNIRPGSTLLQKGTPGGSGFEEIGVVFRKGLRIF